VKIAHVALWTADLDAAATFWATHFGAEIGDLYESRRRPGFTSRFLRLKEGAVIELMSAPWLSGEGEQGRERYGWAHITLSLGPPPPLSTTSPPTCPPLAKPSHRSAASDIQGRFV